LPISSRSNASSPRASPPCIRASASRSSSMQPGALLLLRRPHEHLVDRHVAGASDDEGDDLGDVLGVHALHARESLAQALEDLGPVVAGELGLDGTRLDDRDADVAAGDLLAEGVAESAHAVLGQVVDGAAGTSLPPGDG